MNSKGEVNQLGLFIGIFMAVIVGVLLLVPVAQQVGTTRNTVTSTAVPYTTGVNGTYVDLAGQELLSTPTVVYANGTTVPAAKYSITEGISTTTAYKTIRLLTKDGTLNATVVNVTYNYGADGYIDSSGGRSIAFLIVIFAALAVAVVALIPAARSGVMDLVKGR